MQHSCKNPSIISYRDMNIDTTVLIENSERAMQGTVSVAEIDPA